MRILKLLLALGSVAGATSITSAVGGNPNPLLTTGDIWAGTTNGAPTNLPAGASGTFLGSNGIGIAPTYQLINYSSLTGTVPTWNQSTTGSAATLTTSRTIATSGDAVGTATNFNGSANISIPTTVVAVNGAAIPASKTIVGTNASSQIIDASAATLANNTTGSAATLTTGRTISASGDATGTSAAFNGSAAVTVPLTLATVNSNTGACGDASHVCQTTLNGKGLATAATAVAITPAAIGAQAALSGLTNNVLTKGNGTTGIQSSSITDNGATVSTTEGLSAGSFYVPAGGPINLGSDEIENVTFAGTGFTDVQSGDWLFYDYSPSNQGAIRLGVGTTSSASTLRISYAGIRSVGADTIGSGTGTAILTSGVVSSLSGTNLVLGNGSTIPQSTFQAAGSYLPLAAGASYPLGGQLTVQGGTGIVFSGVTEAGISTSGADGAWFSNSLSGDLNIRAKGLQTLRMGPGNGSGASTLDLNATTGAECYINFKVDGTTTLASSLTGLATLTAGVVGATVTPSVTSLTATGTGTAISAPNGEITSRGNNVVTSILRSYRASQALTSSYASIVSALAGSTTIPANSLSVGDVLHIHASIPSAAGGGTWNLIQYFNGSSIGAGGPSATTGSMVYDAYATVITTGSSGTMEINQNYLFPSPAMYSTGVFSINTTTTNTFDVDAIVSGSATIAYPVVTIEKL